MLHLQFSHHIVSGDPTTVDVDHERLRADFGWLAGLLAEGAVEQHATPLACS
jgi:hypothetical protein